MLNKLFLLFTIKLPQVNYYLNCWNYSYSSDKIYGGIFTLSIVLSIVIFFNITAYIYPSTTTLISKSKCFSASLFKPSDSASLFYDPNLFDPDVIEAKLASVKCFQYHNNLLLKLLNPLHDEDWEAFKYFLKCFKCHQDISAQYILYFIDFSWENELWIHNLCKKLIKRFANPNNFYYNNSEYWNFWNLKQLVTCEDIFACKLYDRSGIFIDPILPSFHPDCYFGYQKVLTKPIDWYSEEVPRVSQAFIDNASVSYGFLDIVYF